MTEGGDWRHGCSLGTGAGGAIDSNNSNNGGDETSWKDGRMDGAAHDGVAVSR